MSTRSFGKPLIGSTTISAALTIPEIYLTGGRLKDGNYVKLSEVFKFCPQSTGENAVLDDGSCDARDSIVSGFVGRWIKRRPVNTSFLSSRGFDPTKAGSLEGASTYDPLHDRIVLYGGLDFPTKVGTAEKITENATILGYNWNAPIPCLSLRF